MAIITLSISMKLQMQLALVLGHSKKYDDSAVIEIALPDGRSKLNLRTLCGE